MNSPKNICPKVITIIKTALDMRPRFNFMSFVSLSAASIVDAIHRRSKKSRVRAPSIYVFHFISRYFESSRCESYAFFTIVRDRTSYDREIVALRLACRCVSTRPDGNASGERTTKSNRPNRKCGNTDATGSTILRLYSVPRVARNIKFYIPILLNLTRRVLFIRNANFSLRRETRLHGTFNNGNGKMLKCCHFRAP